MAIARHGGSATLLSSRLNFVKLPCSEYGVPIERTCVAFFIVRGDCGGEPACRSIAGSAMNNVVANRWILKLHELMLDRQKKYLQHVQRKEWAKKDKLKSQAEKFMCATKRLFRERRDFGLAENSKPYLDN